MGIFRNNNFARNDSQRKQEVQKKIGHTRSLISLASRDLIAEAKCGNADKVKELIQKGAPFTADWDSTSLIDWKPYYNHIDVTKDGTSPIHWTAYYNHVDVTKVLLKSGISYDARTKLNRTPLHIAAQVGSYEIAVMLLAYGAELNAKDMILMTPLHWASAYGHDDVVRLLLDHGASFNVQNKFGKLPHECAEDGAHYSIVRMLREEESMPLEERVKIAKKTRNESALLGKRLRYDECRGLDSELLRLIERKRRVGVIVTKTDENGSNSRKSSLDVRVDENSEENESPSEQTLQMVPKKRLGIIVTKPQKNRSNSENPFLEKLDIQIEKNNDQNEKPREMNKEKTMQFLKEHGIMPVEPDNGTVISSIIANGQSVGLSEAGKLALNCSKPDLSDSHLNKLAPKMYKNEKEDNDQPKTIKITNGINCLKPSLPELPSKRFIPIMPKIGEGNGQPKFLQIPNGVNCSKPLLRESSSGKFTPIIPKIENEDNDQPKPFKLPNGKMIIKIEASKLINMTKEKKFIIKTNNFHFQGVKYPNKEELLKAVVQRMTETKNQVSVLKKILTKKETELADIERTYHFYTDGNFTPHKNVNGQLAFEATCGFPVKIKKEPGTEESDIDS